MNARQFNALTLRGTDCKGALERLCGNESLYMTCLSEFLKDPTLKEIDSAIDHERWDDAFTAVHALKGLAGNLGFIPLMHATGQVVVLIRGGRIGELNDALNELDSCYRDITDGIKEVIKQTSDETDNIEFKREGNT